MPPSGPIQSHQTVYFHSSACVLSLFVCVLKSVKEMERTSHMIISVSSRVIQPLTHFCCCVTLKLGVQLIAAMACVSILKPIEQNL